jgi:adenylate cyclase
MSDVFVSYKRENLAAVGRLVEALRAEGIGVWWDQDIAPNAAWEATIERELAAAKLVIVAWSPAAVASDNVKAEARRARGQGRLLQVFVEPCDPPLFFGERQGVDLKEWTGAVSDAAFRSLLEAVRAGLETASAPSAEPVSLADAAPPALPRKPSLAVMPFANLSGDPEQEYFADGMVVEIVAALSRIRSIFVIASASSLSLKGKGLSPEEAARQLGVRFVLEGSVRKSGDRVRIAVQLIDAAQRAQIWTDRFDDTLEDVFALQDRVALSAAGRIEPTVLTAEIQRAGARPTENMGSYDLYLRSLPPTLTYSKDGMLQALDLLDRAIALDPGFAAALMSAANCHYLLDAFGWSEDHETGRRLSLELTQRALKAAPDDPAILASASGPILRFNDDLSGATALVERAIALNPGSARAWLFRGMVQLRGAGDPDLAIESFETSMRLDPVGPTRMALLTLLAQALFQQGRFSEAVVLLKEVAEQIEPPNIYAFLAASYGHLGLLDEGRAALAQFRALTSQSLEAYALGVSTVPARRTFFLDGIALAEGKGASKTPASAT